MRRRPRELAFEQTTTSRFLPWIIAVMVLLGAMALGGALVLHATIASWDTALSGRLTVQVPRGEDTAAAAPDLDGVLARVASTPGVEGVRLLEDEEIGELLTPWLGRDVIDADLPVPYLIDVALDDGTSVDAAALQEQLAELAPGVLVEDHQTWLSDLARLARTAEVLGLFVVTLIGFCAGTAVIFVTRSELAIHHQVVELLHMIGANDNYVARQFQRHALRLCLLGALIGAAAAMVILLVVSYAARDLESLLVPDVRFGAWQWGLLAAVPLAAPIIAAVTARLTVMRSLAQMI